MFKKPVYPEVEPVKLKPFKGIRPGVYILAILGLCLLLILFALFLLPGMVSHASYVQFDVPLSAVAIYEDDIYLGNASSSIYRTTAGTHNYRLEYQGAVVSNFEEKAEHHYFFTLFSHHVQRIVPTYTFSDVVKEKMMNDFASSVAAYSAVTDYSSSYNFPPLFTNFATDAVALGIKNVEDLWLYAAMHVTSSTMYEDYLQGKKILNTSSIAYNSHELSNVEKDLSVMFDSSKATSVQRINETSTVAPTSTGKYISYKEGKVTMGNTTKVTYPEINELPVTVEYGPFSIGTTVVTEYDYALLVAANPMSAKSNLEALKADGLVDDYYLGGITLSTYAKSKRPIRNISWYAAKAYTEWLSASTGVAFTLPTEAEWTVAALSSEAKGYTTALISEDTDNSTPIGMLGQLWEFTDSAYIPLGRVSYERATLLSKEYPFDAIIVKGGSYANESSAISTETVGVMNKNVCSEFCGFRVVMR
ncbi:MAG: SUMF1/EgtB/PvdO family nonheme iron enzyme [Spirochaetales bacterium]|nr:SUMF1/EgtB/PvdO family nonheme iron enzyme [Candidatus Physcosoma equi]